MEPFLDSLSTNREHQVFLAFSLITLLSLSVAIFLFLRIKALLNRAVAVTANIIDSYVYSTQNCKRNRLTITYKNSFGKPYTGTITVYNVQLKTGDKVNALYDPGNPEKVMDTYIPMHYAAPITFFAIALMFGGILALLFFQGKLHLSF